MDLNVVEGGLGEVADGGVGVGKALMNEDGRLVLPRCDMSCDMKIRFRRKNSKITSTTSSISGNSPRLRSHPFYNAYSS